MKRYTSYRKGISELVIILLILAIAIPAVILLQTWLTNQVSTMPVIDKVRASYQVSYLDTGGTLVYIRITNDGKYPVNISNVKIMYRTSSSFGTVGVYDTSNTSDQTFKLIDPVNLSYATLESGKTLYITLQSSSRATVEKVILGIISSDKPGIVTQLEASGS